jgi:rRNA-processing protein FCF1
MLVTARPGINRDNLLKNLKSTCTEASNLRSGGPGGAFKRLLGYLEWASSTVSLLGNQISNADLERLVLTRRYELLLSGVGAIGGVDDVAARVINSLVSLELDQRVETFNAAIKSLDEQVERWSLSGVFVMPDSSFYIRHDKKLEEADVGAAIGVWGTAIRVLVPMVVVDELDGLKRHSDKNVRWRAGYTLAVFDRLFASTATGPALLHQAGTLPPAPDGRLRGEVAVELLFDAPGHVRLPINDDEIVDRALAVQPLADRNVTLLTYDTNQSARARNAGLRVVKLSKEVGEEPKK